MKNKIITIEYMKYFSQLLISIVAIFFAHEINANELTSQQQKELISNLNYLQYSTAKIKMSDNKAVAEDVYYSIINELKIEFISNRELNFEYGEFLAKCANLKLTQNEKDFIKQLNEKSQKTAYLNAFSNYGAVFVPGQTPHQMAGSLVYTTIANVFAVANTKNQLKTQLEKDMFYLDQNVMRDIYDMQASLFTTSAKLLAGGNSSGRINENSMTIFLKAIKLESAVERKNALSEPQLQQNFKQFPPYWFELGSAYQELSDYSNAIKCYDSFMEVKRNDIVLKDKNYVNLLKNRIQILLGADANNVMQKAIDNRNEILNYLDILKSNYLDSDAGEKNSYLAKIYYIIGETQEALNCLNYIIESKSVYPDLIEDAISLKILINSSIQNEEAKLYQNAFNYSKINFGNSDVDYTQLNQKKGLFGKFWNSIVGFFYRLFNGDKGEDQLDERKIDSDYLCFMIPSGLVANYNITFDLNDKLYIPHYINNNTMHEATLVFIDYNHDDIKENIILTMTCKSMLNQHDVVVKYSISPIKSKIYKAADKAFKRIGSDILVHNAQTAIEFGEIIYNYDYEVKSEEKTAKKIRKKKEKEGKKKNWTKEEINSNITKELTVKLSPDLKYLQERMVASEMSHYKNETNILYSPSIVTYDENYYLVGIVSIFDSTIGKEYSLSSTGDILFEEKATSEHLDIKLKHLLEGARAGDINSMVTLGIAYIEGYDIPKNTKQGLRWLLIAANSDENSIAKSKMNVAQACKYLGQCYWNGSGVKQDKDQAKKWFRKSKKYGFDIEDKYID